MLILLCFYAVPAAGTDTDDGEKRAGAPGGGGAGPRLWGWGAVAHLGTWAVTRGRGPAVPRATLLFSSPLSPGGSLPPCLSSCFSFSCLIALATNGSEFPS